MKPIQVLLGAACCVTSAMAAEYYKEPQLYGLRPNPGTENELGPIGVTGIEARIGKGVQVTVETVQPGTPASGKFDKGDIILGVNGVELAGRNPLPILGSALTDAEASDGKLTFEIQAAKGGNSNISITIPVLGAYGKTFPLNCEKSKKIIQGAAEFYAGKDRLKKHSFLNGLECLFLLSTGDDHYVPRVKEYFSQFLGPDGRVKGIGRMTWDNGYNGVACAEYYLRTGDRSVLPILQYYCDDAKLRQLYGIGWNHWDFGFRPSYESGGGMIHSAGNQVLLTLVLGKVCGVDVDEKTLLGSLQHWYRFAGHGAIPVADQRPWHIFRSGGRDGATAAVMHVASGAKGNTAIYKKAEEAFAMSAITSWPSRNFSWEVIWESLATPYMLEYNPGMYYQWQQRFRWQYDLYRTPSGAFHFHRDHDSLDPIDEGICLALAFTAPLKTLHITGARSKFAKEFTMPEKLWGNEADLAFLSSKHNPDYYKYGKDEEIQIPYWQLPLELRYTPNDVKNLPLEMLLKNVRHARFEVRAAAAKALCMNQRYRELEELLRDPDPRLRRAALDGINDYRPWFLSPVVGNLALKPDQYTPAMQDAITAMMSDPKESWYVIDGALQSLGHGPLELIKKNIPHILPWTTHEDWWLHESAFTALMGLREDEATFAKVLPNMIDVVAKEDRYNPNYSMIRQLRDALTKCKEGSPVRKLIETGLKRAAVEKKVVPDAGQMPRSRAITFNILEAAETLIQQAPESAADLADALAKLGRLDDIETESLMRLVKNKDGELQDRFVGFYPALEKLPSPDRQRLSDILFEAYRPELIKRLATYKDTEDGTLLNLIVDLTKLRKPSADWHAIGTPSPVECMWRYQSFGPVDFKMKTPKTPQTSFEDAALPPDMKNWFKPDFDDHQWKSGRTPIGVGVFKAYGAHSIGWTATPNFSFTNHSDWGTGQYLLMRTNFEVTNLDDDMYRIKFLTDQGFILYLNGQKLHSQTRNESIPAYRFVLLGEKAKALLKKGTNTLAVQTKVRYEQDKKAEGQLHPVGQIDLCLEGLKKKELGLAP